MAKYCAQCGAEAEDGQRFCFECGAPLVMSEAYAETVVEQPVARHAADGFGAQQAGDEARAEGFIQASARVGRHERRGFDVVPVLCAIAGLAAALVVVLLLANRFGRPGFFDLSSWQETMDEPIVPAEPDDSAMDEEPEADESEAPTVEVDETLYGHTASVGNLINGGYVCEDDGWVYYTIPDQTVDWHTSSIGKMRVDGSEQQVIYRASRANAYIWHLVAEGGRLYFAEDDEEGKAAELVSIAPDGSDRKVVTSCMPESPVMLSDGVLYVTDGIALVCYEPRTGTLTRLYGGPGSEDLWRVWNGRVYWFEQGKRTLYVSDLNGDSLVGGVAANLPVGQELRNMQPTAEGIWLLVDSDADGSGDTVMRAELDGSQLSSYVALSGSVSRLNACDLGVFLVVTDSSSTQIILSSGGNGRPTTYYSTGASVDARHPTVCGDYLYFGIHGDPDHLLRVRLDAPGSTPEIVV